MLKMAQGELAQYCYEFGPFRLDAAERLLLRDGEPMLLPPKAFDTLLVLVANCGHILKKDDLMKAVWPETLVEENNLSQYISALRKALGDDPNGHRYIETVSKLGYRFVARVRAEREGEQQRAPECARSEGAPVRSIAVLPFKYLGGEGGDEYLGLGIADAIITRLSNLRQIVVRPTSSVRRYASAAQDPLVAGRELRVEAVLEGNIQRAGNRIRATVQLVSVRDEAPLWAEKFDVEFKDIFTVEDATSEQVARALILKLTREERELLAKRYTADSEAYQLYLKGRYNWNKRSRGGLRTAGAYFQQAIDKDPGYALAYAGLADCYNLHSYYGELSPRESFPKAKAASIKALELDEGLAEAHTSLAFVRAWYDWDWPSAESEFQRALELNPNYATAHHWYALFLMAMERAGEALEEIRRAQEIDPLSLPINRDVGLVYYRARHGDRAIEQYLKTIELDPGFWSAHQHLGWAYEQKAMYEEAIAELNQAIAAAGDRTRIWAELGHVYAVSGRREEAEKVLGELQERAAQGYVSPYEIALIYT
ncbi:MAG: winged helix-turn-helix domain-containing tetratricopeptide repeat protein, partial [Blastocatellia bacterium]